MAIASPADAIKKNKNNNKIKVEDRNKIERKHKKRDRISGGAGDVNSNSTIKRFFLNFFVNVNQKRSKREWP